MILPWVGSEAALDRKPVKAIAFKLLAYSCLLLMSFGAELTSIPLMTAIVVGLASALIADIFFFVQQRHRLSYVLFVSSQVFYSWAFWQQLDGPVLIWLPALLFALAIVVFLLLLPRIDSTLLPTAMTGVVAVQLACAAGEVWLSSPNVYDLLGFTGCLIMPISVILISIKRAQKSVWGDHRFISSLYLLANALIVFSSVN